MFEQPLYNALLSTLLWFVWTFTEDTSESFSHIKLVHNSEGQVNED